MEFSKKMLVLHICISVLLCITTICSLVQICIPLLSQSKNFLQLDIGGSLPFFRKRSRVAKK